MELRKGNEIDDVLNTSFVVIDTETTGLNPNKVDEIVEIAGVKLYQNCIDISKCYEQLVKPSIPIPRSSSNIHKIYARDVANMPKIEDVLDSFNKFYDNGVFVAHNAHFDVAFIKKHFKAIGIDFEPQVIIDTLKLTKALIPDISNHRLDTLIEYFNINTNNIPGDRHRAPFDAICCAIVLKECFDIMKNRNVLSMENIISIGAIKCK